ncbi:MAG TPA: AAA family ATPase, partial [Longimicrobiales bacterium]|nr:AAA family ATPase [Longimicrobiales bacterium]
MAHPALPDLVGRQEERRRIEEALGWAATEGGVAVLISGETGVGKTALARHALSRARARGFLTLEGGSNPLTRNVPYSPLVRALGHGLRSFDQADQASLVDDLPALSALLVGFGLADPEPLGDPGLERTRLFETVLRLLERMSRRAPVAILLDDLQWFDHASVELLAYLTRDLSGLPVFLVASYRPEGHSQDHLGHLLQALRLAGPAVEIELEPLDDDGIARLARRALGDDIPDQIIDSLVDRSAGIPLFAQAMISAWREEGLLYQTDGTWRLAPEGERTAPPVVREAIREQLRHLDGEHRRLVDLIAVAGGRIAHH